MRIALPALVCALALSACQTSKVTLLNDEGGGVGAVAVLDDKTGAERGQLTAADTTAQAGHRQVKAKQAKGLFETLFGFMPRKPFERTLYFENNSVVLAERSKPALAELLEFWTREREVSDLVIVGHTDSTDTDEANDKLSLDRANAVLAVLESQGFKFDGNTKVVGRGERDPLPGHTGENLADEENRRVEIVIR